MSHWRQSRTGAAIRRGTPPAAPPGGYPSIYKGCHWGTCTTGSGLPVPVANLAPGKVTTSWATTQPGTGAYDVAYDIWFNQTPTTAGQPNGTELMAATFGFIGDGAGASATPPSFRLNGAACQTA
jgi:hypothetical protein